MKLSPRDAPAYFARPDPDKMALLIYGADPMRVALRRQEVIAALLGPAGEEEMRLTRLAAGDLRRDPAALTDALRAQGFFPGLRVVFLEDAAEAHAAAITAALADWQPQDARLVVTAPALRATSKLRKFFETHPEALVAAIYDDPPSRAEIEAILAKAGLGAVSGQAMRDLSDLAAALDPGDFRQTVEKLALYKLSDPKPVTPDDLAACGPVSTEAALDDVLNMVAEARSGEIGPVMKRLRAQGVQPVTLCMAAGRHFRALYTVASDPEGPAQGLSRMRPPVFGPRRDRMLRQAKRWRLDRLQTALSVLTEADLRLRSAAQSAPGMALVERALIRIAVMTSRD
ncbi:MAG: DNA polymerase III subunit delta [Pseudomonadota bacterium]